MSTKVKWVWDILHGAFRASLTGIAKAAVMAMATEKNLKRVLVNIVMIEGRWDCNCKGTIVDAISLKFSPLLCFSECLSHSRFCEYVWAAFLALRTQTSGDHTLWSSIPMSSYKTFLKQSYPPQSSHSKSNVHPPGTMFGYYYSYPPDELPNRQEVCNKIRSVEPSSIKDRP